MNIRYITSDIKGTDKYLLGVLLAESEKALTKRWLTQDPPTLNSWINVTLKIYKMEKITFFSEFRVWEMYKPLGKMALLCGIHKARYRCYPPLEWLNLQSNMY